MFLLRSDYLYNAGKWLLFNAIFALGCLDGKIVSLYKIDCGTILVNYWPKLSKIIESDFAVDLNFEGSYTNAGIRILKISIAGLLEIEAVDLKHLNWL